MKALTGLAEEKLDDVEDDKVLRRVYHVMVESLQISTGMPRPMSTGGIPTPGQDW